MYRQNYYKYDLNNNLEKSFDNNLQSNVIFAITFIKNLYPT